MSENRGLGIYRGYVCITEKDTTQLKNKTFCHYFKKSSFKLINQLDAAISQVYYLSFKYSSTCFGHPHAHHQELQQLQ